MKALATMKQLGRLSTRDARRSMGSYRGKKSSSNDGKGAQAMNSQGSSREKNFRLMEEAMEKARKKHKDIDVGVMDDMTKRQGCARHPTGLLSFDIVLGGGLPAGITEIYGRESTGKSTLALQAVASVQKEGYVPIWIDSEQSLQQPYAQNMGIDTSGVWISHECVIENIIELIKSASRSSACGLIVLDSVAGCISKAEAEGDLDSQQIATTARAFARGLKVINKELRDSDTSVIFINQLRDVPNVMGPTGPSQQTTGGKALKYAAHCRVEVKPRGQRIQKNNVTGRQMKIMTEKNRTAPRFCTTYINHFEGSGFDTVDSFIEGATSLGIIERAGAWYKYDGKTLGQGKDKAAEALRNDPSLSQEIADRARQTASQSGTFGEAFVAHSSPEEDDEVPELEELRSMDEMQSVASDE